MKTVLLVLFLHCAEYLWYVTGQVTCTVPNEASCVCDTPEGRIDLTSISNNDGKPRFKGIRGEFFNRYDYSYNPCYGFSTGTHGCSGNPIHAACQEEVDFDDQYSCGLASTEAFVYYNGAGNNELHYDQGQNGRLTVVELICDTTAKTPTLRALDDENYSYGFQLTTECACPGACGSSGGSGGAKGVAPGEIGIVIIVLAPFGLAMYFVIGAIIMRYRFQKEGLEMIPNYKFWTTLPFLIKDGFLFVYRSIYGLIKRDSSSSGSDYDKL